MIIKDLNGVEVSERPEAVKFSKDFSIADAGQGEVTITGRNVDYTVQAVSNGTTAVSVFGASGLPYAITITGVYLIARDTTATNITVEAPASTVVATIAKGATSGAMVGAASLANTSVPAGTNVILDGSSTGVAQVFITYRIA
jgi:hypothetical protein